MATAKIDTVDARTKLKPKSDPYWVKLSSGCTLGFRKLAATSTGTWYARYRDAKSGTRSKISLGEFADLQPSQRYDAAKKAEEQRFTHLGKGGSIESINVKKACENYVQHVRDKKGDKPADELKGRYARWVDGEAIGKVLLPKLTRKQVEAWKTKLAKTPVVENPYADEADQRTRKRSASSINREMTALRAALNRAHDMGDVTDDMAWRVALRPIENADRRRDLYLDREQRQKLMDSAEPAMRLFIRAMTLLPLRTGALAALTVADLDQKNGVLRVGKDKAGADRRIAASPCPSPRWPSCRPRRRTNCLPHGCSCDLMASLGIGTPGRGRCARPRPPPNYQDASIENAQAAIMVGQYNRAVDLVFPAAAHGDARAQLILGNLYASGWGVPEDARSAALWYQQAAKQGDLDAQYLLGDFYRQGKGVPKDANLAKHWLEMAARHGKGAPAPQFLLGQLLETAEATKEGREHAYMWLSIASLNAVVEATRDTYSRERDKLGSSMTALELVTAKQQVAVCISSNYEKC